MVYPPHRRNSANILSSQGHSSYADVDGRAVGEEH